MPCHTQIGLVLMQQQFPRFISIEALYVAQGFGSILFAASIMDGVEDRDMHWAPYFIGFWGLAGFACIIMLLINIGSLFTKGLTKFNNLLNKE